MSKKKKPEKTTAAAPKSDAEPKGATTEAAPKTSGAPEGAIKGAGLANAMLIAVDAAKALVSVCQDLAKAFAGVCNEANAMLRLSGELGLEASVHKNRKHIAYLK